MSDIRSEDMSREIKHLKMKVYELEQDLVRVFTLLNVTKCPKCNLLGGNNGSCNACGAIWE